MNLESPKVTVEKSAQYLFDSLSDVRNFEKLMPDTIAKFEVTLPAYENINRIKDGLLFRIKSPYISLFEQEIDYQINLEENTSNE